MAKVTIEGIEEAKRALRQLAKAAPRDVLTPALKAGLHVLESAVKQRVPVKTGALKATVHTKVNKPRKGKVSGAVIVGDAAHPYVASDEYGNHHQDGQRFLSRAWDAAHAAAERAVRERIAGGVRRII